jgi:hypothetical protein
MASTLFDKVLGAARAVLPHTGLLLPAAPIGPGYQDYRALYDLMLDYYLNVGLYSDVARALFEVGVWTPGMLELRNPASAVVDFYVAHVWAGDLNEALELDQSQMADVKVEAAVKTIFRWSNWGQRKALAVRWDGIFGDTFLKVGETDDSVYLQLIDPRSVTDFAKDWRGNLTYIRLDDVLTDTSTLLARQVVRTEIWDKATGEMGIWVRPTFEPERRKLGTPQESRSLASMGIDFVPFTHAMFRDIGQARGLNAYLQQRSVIDEMNREVTRLHQMLFRYNKPLTVVNSGADQTGRPFPPMAIPNRDGTSQNGTVTMGDDDIWQLPGNPTVQQLVPNIDYASALAAIEADWKHTQRVMPELLYYDTTDMQGDSGRAVRFKLGPAVKRAEEVRGNLEDGLLRALKMALSIAKARGLLTDLGSFDAGDLEMAFAKREILPLSPEEEGAADLANANAALAWKQLGVSERTLLERNGFDPDVEALRREATTTQLGDQLLGAFDRGNP